MTTYFEEKGLSISVYENINSGDNFITSLSENVNDYSHAISANGGFDSMSVTVADQRIPMEEWIEQGIGRHIVVYNAGNAICWEGFVNSVSAKMGGYEISVGPLMDIGNRVSVAYASVDYATSPPTIGDDTTVTTVADNTASQEIYGIIEKVLNGGRVTAASAESIRDTFLAERAYPETSSVFTIGSNSASSLTLECLGYWYWTNAYVYNDTDAGAIQIDERVPEILQGNPNTGMFGALHIDTNNSIVPEESDEDKLAMAHLKEILAIGGATDQRYTLAFYENREAYYSEVPTTPAYKTAMSDQGQRILTYEGALVYPWDIRPAQWLFVSDALIGRYTDASNYYEDPRYMFIEQVSYSIPWNVTLTGNRIGTYDQIMAKFGIGDF